MGKERGFPLRRRILGLHYGLWRWGREDVHGVSGRMVHEWRELRDGPGVVYGGAGSWGRLGNARSDPGYSDIGFGAGAQKFNDEADYWSFIKAALDSDDPKNSYKARYQHWREHIDATLQGQSAIKLVFDPDVGRQIKSGTRRRIGCPTERGRATGWFAPCTRETC